VDNDLQRLIAKMPPPARPRFRDVDWGRLEAAVGLTYPVSFKEFIGVYGGCVWCDAFSPFYSQARTTADAKDFLNSVKEKLIALQSNMYDGDSNKIEIPLYPTTGGLFPFMIDYSSSLYCWRTDRKDPDKWPIVCWFTGTVLVLEKMTISKMLLEWLDRKPRMIDVWGDVNDLPPERRQLTETSEPEQG